MSDDLRLLVQEHLPKLAYQIMRPVVDIPDFGGKWNFLKSANQDALRIEKRLRYSGPAGAGYYYRPVFEGTHDELMSQVYIAFHHITLVDIDDQEIKPTQISQGDVTTIEVVKERNNTGSYKTIKSDFSKTKAKSEEHSLAATAETEFEATVSRKAKATVGVVEGESEVSARFKSRLEVHTDNAWSKSDSITESVETEYVILPYSERTIQIQEGHPQLRTVIPTKGILDCKVEIGIYNAGEWWFDYLDDVKRCWQGVKSGHAHFSNYFARNPVPQSDIEEWQLPHLNLDIEVRAERVRYSGKTDDEFPIKGKEREFAAARSEYQKRGA